MQVIRMMRHGKSQIISYAIPAEAKYVINKKSPIHSISNRYRYLGLRAIRLIYSTPIKEMLRFRSLHLTHLTNVCPKNLIRRYREK